MFDTTFKMLRWPTDHPRTAASARKRATFGSGRSGERRPWNLWELIDGLERELKLYGANRVVVMTALLLSEGGIPVSTSSSGIAEQGVVILFEVYGQRYVMPCDKWDRLEDNLRAIIKHLEAQRGIERWGVATVRQSLSAFVALPAPRGARAMDISMVSRSGGRDRPSLVGALKRMLLPASR